MSGQSKPTERVIGTARSAGVGAACSSQSRPEASPAFCRAADRYNTELERAQKNGVADVERQLPLVEALAETAPKEIKADAETFADALRRVDADVAEVVLSARLPRRAREEGAALGRHVGDLIAQRAHLHLPRGRVLLDAHEVLVQRLARA